MLHILNILGGTLGEQLHQCHGDPQSLTKGLQSSWHASPCSAINFIRVNNNCSLQLQDNTVGRALELCHSMCTHSFTAPTGELGTHNEVQPTRDLTWPSWEEFRNNPICRKDRHQEESKPEVVFKAGGAAPAVGAGSPTPAPGTEPAQPHSPDTLAMLGNQL